MNEKEKEYYCVLVSKKKYKEMLEEIYNCKNIVIPEKYRNENKEKWCDGVETLYSLPVEISEEIEEDMKFVTKEEYDKLRLLHNKRYEEFMKNYEPDYMWNWNK